MQIGSWKRSADFKQTRVVLIATAWGAIAAMFRLATELLITDEGERGTELFVLDNRGLRDLANFVKGPIRQFDPAVTDCQPTVRIIDDGHPLADRRFGLVGWFQNSLSISFPR